MNLRFTPASLLKRLFNSIPVSSMRGRTRGRGGAQERLHSAIIESLETRTLMSVDHLAFTVQPTNSTAGGSVSSITVVIEDGSDNPVSSNALVSFSINTGPDGSAGTVNFGVQAVGGTATLSGLSFTEAGTYTLAANATGITGADSSSFNVSPDVASQLVITSGPVSTTAGQTISSISVAVEDQFGNVVTSNSSTVAIAIGTGSGSLSGTATEAASQGIATFSNLSITKADNYTLSVSDDGVTGATTGSFTISPAAANKLAFINAPGGTTAGQTFSAVNAAIEDTFGNVVTSSSASITIAIESGSGSLLGTTQANAANGTATFSNLSIDAAGSYTVAVTTNGVTGATSGSFTITPAAASKLVFSGEPGSTTAGNLGSVSVSIEDQFGNVITTDSVTTISLAVDTGSGTLGGTTTATVSSGVATFGSLNIHKADGYTLSAAGGELPTATSNSFTISPAIASKLAITQATSSTIAGQTLSSLQISVEDQFGNVETTDNSNVSIAIASGSGTLNGTASVNASSGVATFSNLSIDQAGNFTLAASDGSLTTVTTGSFAISPAAATQLVFTTGPVGATAGNLAGIVATVEDQFGNTVTSNSAAITLAVATGSGSLIGTTLVNAADGVASFSGLAIHVAGNYTLSASASGLTTAVSGSFAITPSAANKLAFTQQPASIVAGNLLTGVDVSVEDQYGNVVTSSNANVTFTVTGGGNTLHFVIGASSGVAALTSIFLTKAGAYSVQASSNGITAATSNAIMVNAAAPFQLVVAQTPSSATAGQTLSSLTVDVEDQFGNIVTTDSSLVTAAVATGSGTLLGTTTVNASSGVAVFSNLSIDTADTYTLQFTDPDLQTTTTSSFNINPGAASHLAFTLQPTNTIAGQTISAVHVTVQDQFGNTVTSDSSNITLGINTGNGTLLGTTTANASSGVATLSTLSIDQAGTFTLAASDGELASADTASFVISPAAASKLVAFEGPSSGAAGSLGTLQIAVEDQFGNVLNNDNSDVVTFAVNSGPGSLSGTAAETAEGGVATFTNLAIDLPGAYTLQATSGTLTAYTSGSFNISPGAPSQLVITQDTSSQTAGQNLSSLQVSVEDQFGNVVTSNSSLVTVAIASGSGTLLGTATASAVNGVATFSNLKIDQAGTFTLGVSASGVTGATDTSFTISAAAASKLAFTQGPATTVAGASISAIHVAVEDQFGNIVTNDTSSVSIAIATGSGTLSGTSTANASSGVATFAGLSITKTGPFTLDATDSMLGAATSGSFSITSGTASQLAIVTAPNSGTAGTLSSMVVDVEDQFGNIVTSDNSVVTIAAASGPASLLGTSTASAVNGVATFNALSLQTAGTYTLSAADGNLTGQTSGNIIMTAGSASQLVYTQQPAGAVAGQPVGAITVSVEDQFGNVVTTDHSTVTLGINANGTDLTLISTASSGVASFGSAAIDIAGSYKFRATDGVLPATLSNSFNITPAAASQLAFTQEPQSGSAGTLLPVIVSVEDQFGNVVTSDNSEITLAMGSGGGVLGGSDSVEATNGVATFNALTITTPGTLTLAATDSGLSAATSSSFTITAAAASKLDLGQGVSSAAAGATLSSLGVSVEDQFGNVVTSDHSTVTVAITSDAGTLLGTTTESAVNGLVTFSNLQIDQAGTYTLTVSDGQLSSALTGQFTISAAEASKLVISQGPPGTGAGSGFSTSVTFEDQFGNIATGDSANITLAVHSGEGELNGTTTVAAVSGVAQFTGLSIDQAGSFTLAASSNGVTGADTGSFNITPASADQLAIIQAPEGGNAGALNTVKVAVEDQFGNIVTGDTSTVTLSAATGPGALLGTTTVQAVAGVATFSNLAIHIGGTYTLGAVDPILNGATSESFVIAAAPASKLVIEQGPTNTTAGDTLPLTVDVEDQFGNIVTNATSNVTITINTGSGELGGTVTETPENGVATFGDLSIDQADTYTLAASGAGLTGADTESFAIRAAAASQLVFTQDPSDTIAGESISGVEVTVEDQFGNTVTSNSSAITIAIGSGPGDLGGTTAVNAEEGVADFSDLNIDLAGTHTLSASIGGLDATGTSDAFNISPSIASTVVIVQGPSSTVAGQTMITFSAEEEDQFGNILTNDSADNITATLSDGDVQVHGTTEVTMSDGVATFSDISIDTAGQYNFTFNGGDFGDATSDTFSITPAAATQLAFSQEPDSRAPGSLGTVSVSVEDQFGNVETGSSASIVVAAAGGTGKLTGTATETAVDGVATFSNLAIAKAGTYTLSASAGGLTGASTDPFILGAKLVFQHQPGTTVAGATIGSGGTLNVLVENASGTVMSNDSSAVTIDIFSGPNGGVLNGTETVDAVHGMASFTDLSLDTAGNYKFVVTDGSVPQTVSSQFTLAPAAPTQMVLLQDASGVTAGAKMTALKVELLDAFNNVATNYHTPVVLTLDGSPDGGAIFGTRSVAPVNGIATFNTLTFKVAGDYTINAAAGGLSMDTQQFHVSPGAAKKLVFNQQPTGTSAGGDLSPDISVDIEDAFGNLVSSSGTVTLSLSSGPAGASLSRSGAASNGEAVFDALSFAKAGKYHIKASSHGLAAATSVLFTITPAI